MPAKIQDIKKIIGQCSICGYIYYRSRRDALMRTKDFVFDLPPKKQKPCKQCRAKVKRKPTKGVHNL